MNFKLRIQLDSPLTISEQIQQQIELAVAKSELNTGDTIPSVRQLAIELGVNPNTVAKALQSLVQKGTLVSQKGRGYFVASLTEKLSDSEINKQLTEAAKQFVASTRPLGVTRQDLLKAVTALLPEGSSHE